MLRDVVALIRVFVFVCECVMEPAVASVKLDTETLVDTYVELVCNDLRTGEESL